MANINFASGVLTLLLVTSSIRASNVKNFTYSWVNSDWSHVNYLFALPYPAGDNPVKPDVNCTRIDDNHSKCAVSLETFHSSGNTTKKTCQSDFYTDFELRRIRVEAVSGEKIAITYSAYHEGRRGHFGKGYHKYRILNASSCKYVETNVTFNFTFAKHLKDFGEVFLYDDGTFDIFKFDSHHCKGLRCKFTFDANGNLLSRPVSYLPEDLDGDVDRTEHRSVVVLGKATNASTPGSYFVLEEHTGKWSDKRVAIKLSGANCTNRELFSVRFQFGIVHDVQYYKGMLGLCWEDNYEISDRAVINCLQFDSDGKKILEAHVTAEARVSSLKVQNLPGGGLLLLNNVCRRFNDKCADFELRNIQTDGETGKPTTLAGIGCADSPKELRRMKIWFGESGDYCAASVCLFRKGRHQEVTKMTGSCVPKLALF